jgi:hypothetical protein
MGVFADMAREQVELMRKIYQSLGTTLKAAAAQSSVPESFLAAVVANESAGNPQASRFEPAVFEALCLVLLGKKSSYAPAGIHHPLGIQELIPYIDPGSQGGGPSGNFLAMLGRLRDLATSWGLTQLMGWHAVEFSRTLPMLQQPRSNLDFANFLLSYFASRYGLDVTKDFGDLLTCWNTGSPTGNTFDPQYVPNGLARQAAYEAILHPPEPPPTSQAAPLTGGSTTGGAGPAPAAPSAT